MKKTIILITGIFLFMLSTCLQAQPDPPGGGHGSGEDQGAGGNAPVGSGLVIMTLLSGVYALKKANSTKKDFEL